MLGSVFIETIKRSWLTTLMWGAGMGAFMCFFVMLTPALEGLDLIKLFEKLPKAMLAAAGIQDVSVLATTTGLLALGFFGKMALFFAAYPAYVGMQITSADEDSGAMDMVLSLPVKRSQMLLEKFIAYSLNIVVLIFLVVGGLLLGLAITPVDDVDTARLVTITLNLIPVLILVLAVTMCIGAFISRRQIVLMLVTGFIIVSYMVFTVGSMVSTDWMAVIKGLSFFSYYNVEYLLKEGTVLWHIGVLFSTALVLVGLSVYRFGQRDIAV